MVIRGCGNSGWEAQQRPSLRGQRFRSSCLIRCPVSHTASSAIARPTVAGSVPALGLSALGIVFGDIGTSPLYTLQTVLGLTAGTPDTATTLRLLSLVIWTMSIGTTVKYVTIA